MKLMIAVLALFVSTQANASMVHLLSCQSKFRGIDHGVSVVQSLDTDSGKYYLKVTSMTVMGPRSVTEEARLVQQDGLSEGPQNFVSKSYLFTVGFATQQEKFPALFRQRNQPSATDMICARAR